MTGKRMVKTTEKNKRGWAYFLKETALKQENSKVNWQFTTEDAGTKLSHFYTSFEN